MLPRDLEFFFRFDILKDVSFNEKKKKNDRFCLLAQKQQSKFNNMLHLFTTIFILQPGAY